MRPGTRPFPKPKRRDLFHHVYGEVYGGVEHGVEAVCGEDTEGEWRGAGNRGRRQLWGLEILQRRRLGRKCRIMWGEGVCTIRGWENSGMARRRFESALGMAVLWDACESMKAQKCEAGLARLAT